MAKRDFDKYYNEVAMQYHDMLQEIKDFEQEVSNNMFSPEKLDEIKESIAPLRDNYLRLSYVKFLLDKPAKKSKQKQYLKINKRVLNEIGSENTDNAVITENQKIIDNFGKNT